MTGSPDPGVRSVAHTVQRLEIHTGAPFDEVRDRFEAAVPEFDGERTEHLVAEGVAWEEIVRAADENAPHGFIRYWSLDATPLMALAGHSSPCVEYLVGNHTIAERMFRHHPGVLLYAPLRAVIHADHGGGGTVLAIDQPSTLFASFGVPAIAEVGLELDRKLAALLETLGLPVPGARSR